MFLALDHTLHWQAEEIHVVLLAGYQEEAKLLGAVDFPPLHRTVEDVQTAVSQFFGYQQEATLAGVVEIEPAGEQAIHIASFVVHPSMFRRGIGSTMLSDLFARYKRNMVTVSTAVKNAPAIGLYQKCGFKCVSEWQTPDGYEIVTLRRESG